MAHLTAAQAREIWRYDAETGQFFWLASPRYEINAGDRAGFFDGRYWRLRWRRSQFKASRMAWLMVTGEWPKDQIDHINGDKTDDRFCNLREASNAQNCRNIGVKATNRLGIKGVSVATGRRGYVAQIQVDGANIYLGYFASAAEAKAVYDKAARRHHGEFVRAGA